MHHDAGHPGSLPTGEGSSEPYYKVFIRRLIGYGRLASQAVGCRGRLALAWIHSTQGRDKEYGLIWSRFQPDQGLQFDCDNQDDAEAAKKGDAEVKQASDPQGRTCWRIDIALAATAEMSLHVNYVIHRLSPY